MDLSRLLSPRSIAIVGATERPGSYGGEALLNLRRLGFDGPVRRHGGEHLAFRPLAAHGGDELRHRVPSVGRRAELVPAAAGAGGSGLVLDHAVVALLAYVSAESAGLR